MKKWLVIAVNALVLSGCVSMKPNPAFSNCANNCNSKQDACMVNASSAADISRCNTALDKCVAQCEAKYPRYINP